MVRPSVSILLLVLCAGCPPTLDRPPPADSAQYLPLPDSIAADVPAWLVADSARGGDRTDMASEGLTPDVQQPDLSSGSWVQANSKNCLDHCATLGKMNVPSPEGAHCMSGEVRPKSGIDAGITFTYGCSSSCAAQGSPIVAANVGVYCYRSGQKQDNDSTDLTVGCFCH
jgi:hypothetical protein